MNSPNNSKEGDGQKADCPASPGSGRSGSGNGFFGPLKGYAEHAWEAMKGFRPTWTDKDFYQPEMAS